MKVVKKDGTLESFNRSKIITAIRKSSKRVCIDFSQDKENHVVEKILAIIKDLEFITVEQLHGMVEKTLYEVDKIVAQSYMNYRNYKREFGNLLMDDIETQILKTLNEVDRENSNSNTRYISTKRTEIAQTFSKEMYQKMFLATDVLQAMRDGYIYVHDLKDMILPQFNCCLTDISSILKGGFELENIWYNEPKDIRTAVGQIGDIIMVISAQHFGGNSTPQIDKILAPYYKMTIEKYLTKYTARFGSSIDHSKVESYAKEDAYNDLKQSLQGLEVMLNTVVSARGSYPFTTFSFGDVANELEADISKAILEVRLEGHGKTNFKKTMIFPKLVFLHNKINHGIGGKYEWLFEFAIKCSSTCMYPDYIGDGHKHENKWITPMGCRAFLSDFRDEKSGELVYEGRFNIGANSLNLPMIFMKAKTENRDFFELLESYLEMIRSLHKQRYEYLGKAKASSNPLMFTQGGAYGGFLKPDEKITPLLKSATASFGITALHELTLLATGKSLKETNGFAIKVMDFINEKIEKYKSEDGRLYAIYNVPAESLCGTQLQQFKAKYGEIAGVSDKEYFTNSNHLWVGEEINPIQKQDKEEELFHKSKGGHIQYIRVANPANLKALRQLIERGLGKGFYQGINFNACTCLDCGNLGNDFGEKCPKCDSQNVDEINRVTGYLGFSRKSGDRTLNDAMMANVRDRQSM